MALKPLAELKDRANEWREFERANGEMACGVCGQPLNRHPQPLELTCPTMVEDCAGRWWKT